MEILMEELCFWICKQCFKLLDACMSVFNAITGISDVWDNSTGSWTNLVTVGITNSAVTSMLWAIFIVGVFLACVFAIVAIIRNMMTNKTSTGAIAGKLCISLVGTIAVFALVILGVMVANELLQILAQIMKIDSASLSFTVFSACVGNAWNYDAGWSEDKMRALLLVSNEDGTSYVDWSKATASEVLGDYKSSWGIWPKSWKNNGAILPDDVSWLCMLIGVIGTGFFIIVAALNMCRRLFELVYIYLCLPAAMSTIPMDDGARMKNWTDAMVARFLQVYGCVFAVGTYTLLIGITSNISLAPYEYSSSDNFVSTLFSSDFGFLANALLQVMLLVGGAMCIPQGQNLFMRLFGGREDMRMTWGAGRMVAGAVRSVGRAAATVGTAGAAAGIGFVGGAVSGVVGANKNEGGDVSKKAKEPQSSETQINDKKGGPMQDNDGSQGNSSDGGFKGSNDESKIGGGSGASGGESGGSQTENLSTGGEADAKDNAMTEPGAERNIAENNGQQTGETSAKSEADIKAEKKAADKAAKAQAKEAKAHQKQIYSETPYKYQNHNGLSRFVHYAAKGAATGASTAFHMVAMTGLLGRTAKSWDANHMAKRAANKKAENDNLRAYEDNGKKTPTQVKDANDAAEKASAAEKAQNAKAQATRDETQNRILTEMHEMNAKLDSLKNPSKTQKPEGD